MFWDIRNGNNLLKTNGETHTSVTILNIPNYTCNTSVAIDFEILQVQPTKISTIIANIFFYLTQLYPVTITVVSPTP